MRSGRHSIAGAMALVAVIAVNIGAGRALHAADSELLLAIAPCALVSQAALYLLWVGLGRPRRRAFWIGFAAADLAAMATLIWAMTGPDFISISAAGRLPRSPGVRVYFAWYQYMQFTYSHVVLPLLLLAGVDLSTSPSILRWSRIAIWTLPQLLIALGGGLLAVVIADYRAATGPAPESDDSHREDGDPEEDVP